MCSSWKLDSSSLNTLLSLLRLLENGMAFHPHAFSNKPREKIGVIIFPTRTTRYKKGSPLKFICMCIVWSPSNFVISWPLHTPTYPNHLLWGFTGVLSLSSHKTKMAKWFHLQIRFLYKPMFLFSYSMQCLCTSPPSLGRQNTPCCASWQSVGTVNPPTLPWIHHTNLGKESIYVGTRCTVHPKNYEQCCNKNSHVYVYIYILYIYIKKTQIQTIMF